MKKTIKVLLKTIIGLTGIVLILFIILYFATSGDYKIANTVEQDPTIPHINIGNAVFHSETFGNDSNEIVIVIHGGPGNDYRYLLPLKQLANDYYVVFYDQRGTGLSPRVPAAELSLETSLDDLHNIINYYSPEKKVNLIGHSWGAMLASGYIGMHPQKINKAVLVEPGLLTTEKAKEFTEVFKLDLNFNVFKILVKSWFQSLHVKGPDNQAEKDYFFYNLVMNSDLINHPMSKYFCNDDLSNASMELWRFGAVASQVIHKKGLDENGDLQIDLVKGVDNFKNKVLFLCGECNSITGAEYQKDHMKYFPNVEIILIKNAGHTLFGEKPVESLNAVRNYFKEG